MIYSALHHIINWLGQHAYVYLYCFLGKIIGIKHNSMAQLRPQLPNFTQHSDQVCRIRLGIDHIISSRTHWQGDWKKIKVSHSMENTLLLCLGKLPHLQMTVNFDQMVSSGLLQVNLHWGYSLYGFQSTIYLTEVPKGIWQLHSRQFSDGRLLKSRQSLLLNIINPNQFVVENPLNLVTHYHIFIPFYIPFHIPSFTTSQLSIQISVTGMQLSRK